MLIVTSFNWQTFVEHQLCILCCTRLWVFDGENRASLLIELYFWMNAGNLCGILSIAPLFPPGRKFWLDVPWPPGIAKGETCRKPCSSVREPWRRWWRDSGSDFSWNDLIQKLPASCQSVSLCWLLFKLALNVSMLGDCGDASRIRHRTGQYKIEGERKSLQGRIS